MTISYAAFTDELRTRLTRGVISMLAPQDPALRGELERRLGSWPGEPDSLLATPVFEHRFDYPRAPETMADLADSGFLDRRLVKSLDTSSHRFPADRHPYAHQLEAWRVLEDKDPRSLVVSTGTGSGKTECFLVPLLDDLAREATATRTALTGVRALLLYPLNALIESQQDRLSAWTKAFKGGIRYALYNGDTPNEVPQATQDETPQQVLDRRSLRAEPPPILLTNGTMLEYMLVRPEDTPILQASQGKLRYIVIDEAHTYLGSSAAELALLLRRVMLAFGVWPQDVRFVATSATIASADRAKTERDLTEFLAGVAGVTPGQVSVVTASRLVPPVDATDPAHAASLTDPAQFGLRTLLARHGVLDLKQLRGTSSETGNETKDRDVLRGLDRAHRSVDADGQSFLPLKGHFHARGLPGVWLCLRSDCVGRKGTHLDSDDWKWGPITLHPRERCEHCSGLLWPVAVCQTCGHLFLQGEHEHGSPAHFVPPDARKLEMLGEADDQEPADDDPDEDGAVPKDNRAWACLDKPDGGKLLELVHPKDGAVGTAGGVPLYIQRASEGRPTCPRCGIRPPGKGDPFRGLRAGQAFVLGIAMQVALEALPGQVAAKQRPFGGRRLLTFTDSRQGSARFAATRQSEAERLHVRYLIWSHARVLGAAADPAEIAKKAEGVALLEGVVATNPALAPFLVQQKEELAALSRPKPVPLSDLVTKLSQESTIGWMYADRKRFPGFEADVKDDTSFARMLLLRELLRRPRRRTSIEAMGLVRLRYGIPRTTAPSTWRAHGRTDQEWQDFLRMVVDLFVRQYVGVEINPAWLRWMGVPFRASWLQPPGQPGDQRQRLLKWPAPGAVREGLILRLLRAALGLGDDSAADDTVSDLMAEAWAALCRANVLKPGGQGHRLDLLGTAAVELADKAWLCPLTGSVSDTLIYNLSPFVPDIDGRAPPAPVPLDIPLPPFVFRSHSDGSPVSADEARDWLETDGRVWAARTAGLWSEFHDRLVLGADLYFVREHSAQLDTNRLRRHVKSFKDRWINVLSCSTTMEMGVDLDDLPAVMMNNVPPGPSNYLQRAGRSGRRGETAALAVTVARALPHDHLVFTRPTWAFTTPIHVPGVALDRPPLVQRHVNARVLQAFLAMQGKNPLKLTCGGFFFEGNPSASDRFLSWLRDGAATDAALASDLPKLAHQTALEGWPILTLLTDVGRAVEKAALRVSAERSALLEERKDLPEKSPAARAVEKQLQRLEGEYLLGFLAGEQVLPGNGIPTDVVPFVNLTMNELRTRKAANDQPLGTPDDRRRFRAREFPSYDASKALRAYAPGRSVVVDGLAYISRGVTLNWKRPVLDGPSEVQSIRWVYRCPGCGTADVVQKRPASCSACGVALVEKVHSHAFLEPAGFTVDIGEDPTTDLPQDAWTDPRPAWVSAGKAPFESIGAAGLAEVRWAPDGLVFHYADGNPHIRRGYALCLCCGRAAPHDDPTRSIPPEMEDHRRLRKLVPPVGEEPECPGATSPFGVKTDLWLGAEVRTEVFELRLQPPGVQVTRAAATSIAVALRSALGNEIGVETEEMGYAVTSRKVDGEKRYTIALFDTAAGGAGFVGEAPARIADLLRAARARLACKCDRACERCLLDYGTQFDLEHLDRYAALAVLTPELIAALDLPSELRFPGRETVWEWEAPGRGLLREARRIAAKRIRIHLHGAGSDADLAAWSTNPLLSDLQRFNGAVELVLPPGTLEALRDDELALLAGLARAPLNWKVLHGAPSIAAPAGARVWAEAEGADASLAFAGGSNAAVSAGDRWLSGPGWVVGKGRDPLPDLPSVPAAAFASTPHAGWREFTVLDELNGPVSEVGRRLFELVIGDDPTSAALGAATTIEVCDRYLRRPGPLANLRSVVSELARREWIGADTRISLTTARATEVRTPTLLEHEWSGAAVHEAVVSSLFDDAGSFSGTFVAWPTEMPHHRELTVAWPSGRRLRVRIDQGFGIVGPARGPFPFGAEPEAQAEALKYATWSCSRPGGFGTSVYVRWE
ncbi:MAG: DEAD/DEAH box helicase [Myxococcota bacterium]